MYGVFLAEIRGRLDAEKDKRDTDIWMVSYMFRSSIYRCQFSRLLPADYCQRELPFDVQQTRTELVWKSDTFFGYKALGPKATAADVNHYCQLGKMDAQ